MSNFHDVIDYVISTNMLHSELYKNIELHFYDQIVDFETRSSKAARTTAVAALFFLKNIMKRFQHQATILLQHLIHQRYLKLDCRHLASLSSWDRSTIQSLYHTFVSEKKKRAVVIISLHVRNSFHPLTVVDAA